MPDVVVIGAGMAGASVAALMAERGADVVVLEAEDQPGRHTTGRSAAVFTESYGNVIVRSLTIASRSFLESPPHGFTDVPLLAPRGALWIGREDQIELLDELFDAGHLLVPSMERLDPRATRDLVPALAPSYLAGAVWEPDARDIDVDALLQGYLRLLRGHGGRVVTGAGVTRAVRTGDVWSVATAAGEWKAPWLVNAAGAWADTVAKMAGASPLGLVPLRRTAFIFDAPVGSDPAGWPIVIDAGEEFYCKPEGRRLLGSPADETPSEPCDARPEEVDVAMAIERLGAAFGTELRNAYSPWAGLRTFAPDRTPVVGADADVDGLLWLAGQGGYGIQTAPAMAAAATGLLIDGRLPAELETVGLTAAQLSPARFQAR